MVGIFINGKLEDASIMSTKCTLETMLSVIDDVVVIDVFKGNKLKNILPDGTKFVKYLPNDLDGWKSIEEYATNLLVENKIDTLIVFKNILANRYKCDNMGMVKNFDKKIKQNDTFSFNFKQSKDIYTKYMFVKCAANVCKNVYQFILDPQEPALETYIKFDNFKRLYGMNRIGYTFMPCFEYGVNKYAEHIEKEIDFIFYCSAVTSDRQYIANQKEKLESIDNWDIQINVSRSKIRPLKQNEYYHKLAQSRYSLCIPAYDKTAFSMYRFIEALCNDCLCFIHKNVCLTDAKLTFPDIYDIMIKYLLIDNFKDIRKKIESMPESKRLEIIEKIKSTNSWKKIMDIDLIKRRWSKLKGVND